jgi:peroxiredoxin
MLFKGQLAPDFELNDVNGKPYRLSEFRGEKVVLLAFLRGFM